MKRLRNASFALCLVAMSQACLDTATNDDEVLPPVDEDLGPVGGDGSSAGDGASSSDGESSGDGASSGDGGDGTSSGDGTPADSAVAGTALSNDCSSYAPRTATSCFGYYCGVSLETVESELAPGRTCDIPAEDACEGTISRKVGPCTVEVKSNPENLRATDVEIRSEIAACVYKDAHIKEIASMACLDCYLDGAMCASKHCVLECLGMAETTRCDDCRERNNCNQPVPGCAGLPNPF